MKLVLDFLKNPLQLATRKYFNCFLTCIFLKIQWKLENTRKNMEFYIKISVDTLYKNLLPHTPNLLPTPQSTHILKISTHPKLLQRPQTTELFHWTNPPPPPY